MAFNMFWNIYSKRVLCYLRNRDTIIWTWLFPLLLSTLFYAVFTNIDTVGQFRDIPIGVIDNEAYKRNISFRTALEAASGGDGDALFDPVFVSGTEEADALLKNGDIEGYIVMDGSPLLIVSDNGINQTIIKSFLDRYLQIRGAIEQLITQNPDIATRLPALINIMDYTEEITLSKNPPTDKVNYFYALLAMVCMYGGFHGLITATQSQANLSPLGERKTIAPVGRFRMIAYDLLGGVTIQYLSLLMVVAYIRFALGISFGSKLLPLLTTCLVGCVMGVSFGAMITAAFKLKEQAKVAILVSVSMICCFLSGMMVAGVNYAISEKYPVIAWLNPAARITDALYCLYYFDTYDRFFLNIGAISIMAAAMLAVTSIFIRRQRYDNI